MLSAVVATPVNSSNLLWVDAGFDSESGAIPAVVVSGTTGSSAIGIESAHLWNNGSVVVDTSNTTGAGANSVTVRSTLLLGHQNANLTLKTTASGQVMLDADVSLTGTLAIDSPNVTFGGQIAAASITSTATGVTVVDGGTLQDAINLVPVSGTVHVQAGDYSSVVVPSGKSLTISGNGVATIHSASPALIVDNATVTVTGLTIIDESDESPAAQPAIIVRNTGSLTLVDSTVKEEDTQTSPLVTVDMTSSLDVSSGDNEFDATVSGTGFIAAAAGSAVSWGSGNTLNMTLNEDGEFVIDARVDGSAIQNLFTSPATNGSVIINVDGTLTYTPAANFYGLATFDFETDAGERLARSMSTSAPVNDQPTFVNGVQCDGWGRCQRNSGSRRPDQYRQRGSWPSQRD